MAASPKPVAWKEEINTIETAAGKKDIAIILKAGIPNTIISSEALNIPSKKFGAHINKAVPSAIIKREIMSACDNVVIILFLFLAP